MTFAQPLLILIITSFQLDAKSDAAPRSLIIEPAAEMVPFGQREPVDVRVTVATNQDAGILALETSLGHFRGEPVASGPGVYLARYVPPAISHPAVALIVGRYENAQQVLHGAARIILLGAGHVEVDAPPGAAVELQFDGRRFAPQSVAADGTVSFELVGVPPGESVYHVGISSGEADARLKRVLPAPRFPTIAIGPLPETIAAGSTLEVAVAATTLAGRGYPGRRLSCELSGRPAKRYATAGELAVFRVELPDADRGKVQLRCWDLEGHTDEKRLELLPPRQIAREPPVLRQQQPASSPFEWARLRITPRSGYVSNLGKVNGPLVSVGLQLQTKETGMTAELSASGYTFVDTQLTEDESERAHLRAWALPLLGRGGFLLNADPARFFVQAAVGLTLLRRTVSSTSSSAVTANSMLPTYGGFCGMSWPLGGGRIVFEVGYIHAFSGDESFRGNVGGWLAAAGYEFALWN